MKDLSNSIAELVDSINHGAKAIGTSIQNISPAAWKIAVYQAKLTAWIHMGIWVFIASIVAYVAYKMHLYGKKNPNVSDIFESWCWILLCVAFLVAIIAIGEGAIVILNPEYTAGTEILQMLVKHDN
jgi:hypothetical protein